MIEHSPDETPGLRVPHDDVYPGGAQTFTSGMEMLSLNISPIWADIPHGAKVALVEPADPSRYRIAWQAERWVDDAFDPPIDRFQWRRIENHEPTDMPMASQDIIGPSGGLFTDLCCGYKGELPGRYFRNIDNN